MVGRLRVSMRPFWARIHLGRRWGRVTLILSHVVALRLVGRVGRRVGRAGSRDWGIYRNVCVRLHVVGVRAMVIELPIAATEGDVHRRTCCLNHTCRAAGLCVRRVMVLRRATHVIRVRGWARSGRWLVQTVVWLRRVGGRNIGGGSCGTNVGLRRVLGGRTNLRLRGVRSSGSSRSLVYSWKFRRRRDRRWIWKMRTWLRVLRSRSVIHIRGVDEFGLKDRKERSSKLKKNLRTCSQRRVEWGQQISFLSSGQEKREGVPRLREMDQREKERRGGRERERERDSWTSRRAPDTDSASVPPLLFSFGFPLVLL